MKVGVFTMRFDPEPVGFDDAALVTVLEPREALSVSARFYVFDGLPTRSLVV